jgi:CheY-like chemotaxis protein
MAAKRALIVDDSKSARAFLSRILTRYDIEVDMAESAEQAIEYLGGARPDVIFMDHLMPGMDGFQAVQLIKNNPRTATIPIMMYTSQEGELYVGQARALGAIGVLPKQIAPTDVSKVLYQLKLIEDRRSDTQRTFVPAPQATGAPAVLASAAAAPATGDGAAPIAPPALAPAELRGLVESVVREYSTDLRRAIAGHFDDHAARLIYDVRNTVQETVPAAFVATTPRTGAPWGWIMAGVALIGAAAAGWFGWQEMNARRDIAVQLADAQARIDALSATVATQRADAERTAQVLALAGVSVVSHSGASTGGIAGPGARLLARALVPYGEVPLSNDRIAAMNDVLTRLVGENFRGVVEVVTIPGRFCLVGNATEGYSLAPDDTPVARCDLIGNPALDGASPAQRESIAFANLVAQVRRASRGALDVRAIAGESAETLTTYPAIVEGLTAGDWNRAGNANNRVELRARPAG